MTRNEKITRAMTRASLALKKYSRRSKAAQAVIAQMWNVALVRGCYNELNYLTTKLINKYR